jgi:hypothetical protein
MEKGKIGLIATAIIVSLIFGSTLVTAKEGNSPPWENILDVFVTNTDPILVEPKTKTVLLWDELLLQPLAQPGDHADIVIDTDGYRTLRLVYKSEHPSKMVNIFVGAWYESSVDSHSHGTTGVSYAGAKEFEIYGPVTTITVYNEDNSFTNTIDYVWVYLVS